MTTILIGFITLVLLVVVFYGIIKIISIVSKVDMEEATFIFGAVNVIIVCLGMISYGIGTLVSRLI